MSTAVLDLLVSRLEGRAYSFVYSTYAASCVLFLCQKSVIAGFLSKLMPLFQISSLDYSLEAVDDLDECRLQAGAANQESVNIELLAEIAAVLIVDATSVEDAGFVGGLLRDC